MKKTRIVSGAILLVLVTGAVEAQRPNLSNRPGTHGQMVQGEAFAEFQTQQQEKAKAFLDAELKEGTEFMASIAGRPKAEKLAAIRAFKTDQYQKNCAFREEMFRERKAFLEQRAGSSAGGGAEMKDRLAARMEAGFQEMKAFFEEKHRENLAFLDQAAAGPNLDGAKLDEALRKFFESQKQAAKEFMQRKKSPGEGVNRR